MSKKKGIIICLLFLFCHGFYAQVKKENQTLRAVILQIEQEFDCSFSYADENIENITIAIPSSLTTLQEVVNFLQDNTPLNFTLLQDNVVAISNKKSSFYICGYLVDIDTGEAISNVAIQTNNQNTISDVNGYFELVDVPTNQLVSLQHISYKTVRYVAKKFTNKNCNSHYLVPNIEQIREIVIHNYLAKGIRKTTTGSFDIDYSNFGILPGLIEPDVLQTIQALPGIQSVDETVSNINIRGGSHAENLLLWDGIKMYQSGHFFGLISAFNPYLTKNAILIKNGTNANYTDGVSGSILMATDTELNHNFKTEIGLNLINADVLLDMPIGKKSSLQLSARKSINELWKTPTYKQYFEKAFQDTEVIDGENDIINSDDDFSFYDVNARWLYQISEVDRVRVNLLNFSNDLTFQEDAIVDGTEEFKQSSAEQDNLAASIFYERIWSDRFSTEIQSYVTKYLLKSTNHDIINNQRLIQQNEVVEESIKLDTKYILTDQLTLYNGYQYFETGITNIQDVDNPLFFSKTKEVIRAHGLSSQVGYQSKNKGTNVRVGLRLNYIEKFGEFLVEPRLSFSQQFLNNFTLEFLGEIKHQTATQIIDFQEDFLGVENRRWILSNNDDIPIIKSKQASVGIHYHKKGWLLSVEGYYKIIDGITSKSQGFQNQYQYVKTTGSYRVYGGDFLINKRFINLNTWLSYSYVDNQYTFEEFAEVNFPNNLDIKHSLSFASSYALKNFKVSAGINWHSGKPTTEPVKGNEIVGREINYQPTNSSRLDSYMRMDASANYNFNLGKKVKATTSVSVWNLLNTKNVINKYYRVSDRNTTEEVVQTSLGLTPNVSFRVSF
ncbi:MAG: TonB-dependent receptor [Flavobacteriaceae bacterium]